MVGPLGLRRSFLPYIGEDCVTSRKNVCVEAGYNLRSRRSKGKGKEIWARHALRAFRARNLPPVPFQTPEKVLGLTWYRVKAAAK